MLAWANTNADPDQWVVYGGKVQACAYTAADSSQITIWSKTLDSKLPTMAALAYYAQVAYTGTGGNPSDGYCLQLGGAWQVGDGLDGGGWATDRGQNVYGMCMFGDGSAIDAWGLLYHAYGIVRGVDLSTVLRFKNPY
jgi:putative hemolysin